MKGKNLKPRIFYPARLSFRFDGEIKSFPDTQKLREFSTTKPVLQQKTKAGNQEKEDLPTENKPKTIKKMIIGSYILIIILNANGLNAPTKRQHMKTCACKHVHLPNHSA